MSEANPNDPDRLFMQALGFLQNGLYDPAEKLLVRAIQVNQAQGRLAAEAYARMALARLHADQEALQAAQLELERAAEALFDLDDRPGQARVAFEMGELAERRSDQRAARAAYQQALALAETRGDEATAHMRLGALEREAGDLSTAEEHYRAAVEAFRDAGNQMAQARAMFELASVLETTDPDLSQSLLAQAHAIATDWGDVDLQELIASKRA